MRFFLIFFLLIAAASPLQALAAAPEKLGSFHGWQAFQVKTGGQAMCYMVLRAAKEDYRLPEAVSAKTKNIKNKKATTKTAPNTAQDEKQCQRSEIYLMVTFRPAESMNPVVSYRSGYIFKQGSEVLLNTGTKPFNLFTDKDQAWARSSAMDVAVTSALRKARSVTIKGVSTTGGKSSDIFNLDGAESAYKAIVKACGIT